MRVLRLTLLPKPEENHHFYFMGFVSPSLCSFVAFSL